MSEMVERVANAILGWMPSDVDDNGKNIWDDWSRGQAVGCARAAIQAMREPTGPMLGAASVKLGVELSPEQSGPCWRAMIDEALR